MAAFMIQWRYSSELELIPDLPGKDEIKSMVQVRRIRYSLMLYHDADVKDLHLSGTRWCRAVIRISQLQSVADRRFHWFPFVKLDIEICVQYRRIQHGKLERNLRDEKS